MGRYVRTIGGLAGPAEQVNQLNVQLVNVYLELDKMLRETWFDEQRKGQLKTALTTLQNVMNGSFARLAGPAKAGDPEALRRIKDVSKAALEGMSDIMSMLRSETKENLSQLFDDIDRDLKKTTEKMTAAAAGTTSSIIGGLFEGAPLLTVGALALGALILVRRFS